MAAFCSSCGKPLAPDTRFCGGCGAVNSTSAAQPAQAQPAQAQPVQPTAAPVSTAPVKTGSSALKILLVVVLVGGAVVVMAAAGAFYFGSKKLAEWRQEHGTAASGPDSGSSAIGESHHPAGDIGSAFLSKEEVGAIIGVPVTSIEFSSKSDANYKTANPYVEASIEIERKSDEADAIQEMEAARKVTQHVAGGTGDKVAGVGDDAIYGGFNVIYVRKNDVILTITPPNLQMAAQAAQMNHIYSQPMGSDAQRKELEKLGESMKGDPVMGSLSKPDAMSGAVDLIRHSASERGNEYETKARLMARQMAEKVLAKIGT